MGAGISRVAKAKLCTTKTKTFVLGNAPHLVPAPERDEAGIPIVYKDEELTRDDLVQALEYVAKYINDRGAHITMYVYFEISLSILWLNSKHRNMFRRNSSLAPNTHSQRNTDLHLFHSVAIGGAVSTILLGSRGTTHDIDFFTPSATPEEAELLRGAAKSALTQSSVQLGGNWLNNSVVLFMPRALRVELTKEAIEQDDVLFHEPGLKIFAAPWKYAFCMKIHRIVEQTGKQYDVNDAARYLARYINKEDCNSVTMETIMEWLMQYSVLAPTAIIRKVNIKYLTYYGKHGVLFAEYPVPYNEHEALLEKYEALLEEHNALVRKHGMVVEENGVVAEENGVVVEEHGVVVELE
ncbi:hypothetical protein MMC18_004667 [Xylographa bjoerkii]|nr:hypothetical protein [Xylographa bjoerkii]